MDIHTYCKSQIIKKDKIIKKKKKTVNVLKVITKYGKGGDKRQRQRERQGQNG